MTSVAPSTTIICSNLCVENIRLKVAIVKSQAGSETVADVRRQMRLFKSPRKFCSKVYTRSHQALSRYRASFGVRPLGFDAPDFQNLPLTTIEPASKVGPDALLVHGFQVSLEAAVAIDETNTKYAHSA